MKARLSFGVLILLMLVGIFGAFACNGKSSLETQPIQVMQQTYIVTFDSLTDANEAGLISDADYLRFIVPAHRAAQDAIAAAKAAEAKGDSVAMQAAKAAFARVMAELEPWKQKTKVAPPPVPAGMDLASLTLFIGVVLKLAEALIGIGGKLLRGETLSEEDKAFLNDQQARVAARVEARAREIQGN